MSSNSASPQQIPARRLRPLLPKPMPPRPIAIRGPVSPDTILPRFPWETSLPAGDQTSGPTEYGAASRPIRAGFFSVALRPDATMVMWRETNQPPPPTHPVPDDLIDPQLLDQAPRAPLRAPPQPRFALEANLLPILPDENPPQLVSSGERLRERASASVQPAYRAELAQVKRREDPVYRGDPLPGWDALWRGYVDGEHYVPAL